MRYTVSLYVIFILALRLDAQETAPYVTLPTSESIIYDICFSDGGSTLAIADGTTVRFFSTKTNKELSDYKKGHTAPILALDLSRDSSLMVSGGRDSSIVIWDVKSRNILSRLQYHSGQVTCLGISSDNKYIVSAGTDRKIFVYHLLDRKLLYTITDHSDIITSLAISPDGKLLATASADRTVRLYDLAEGSLLSTFSEHKSWVRDLSFNNDGSRLFSCGDRSKLISRNITRPSDPGRSNVEKVGSSWLMCLDYNRFHPSWVTANIKGKVIIHAPIADLTTNLRCPVHKVRFQPLNSVYMKLAVATRGKGVILVYSRHMKTKK